MTRDPNERNSSSGNAHRGRRLRADEVRRARQSRAAPISGRVVQSQQYQPRLSDQFSAVQDTEKKGWTPLRMGLAAAGMSIAVLIAIFVIPVLLQMQRTIDTVIDDSEPRVSIVEEEDGTLRVVPHDDDDGDQGDDFDDIDFDEPELPDWGADERINIMLLGVDSRGEDDGPARSDTIILVTIDPKTNEVGMMSIPRDLQVEIPGLGPEKINAAYAQGGRELTRAVVEYHFDIDIHYYASVDFVGFINIVDIVGGVIVNNPAVVKDDNYEWTRVYFPTGLQHMDGETALRYVRTRYDDNDFARGYRQQQVLRALRQQGVRLNLITRVRDLLEEVEESFRTDLSLRQQLALARMANDIDSEDIQSYSILEGTTEEYVPGRYYYLIPDWDVIHEIMRDMIPPEDRQRERDDDIQPVYAASVLVENATFVDRLAARSSDTLIEAGYDNVDVAQSASAGGQPTSQIIVYNGMTDTALDIAELIGLDPDQIIVENGSHPSGYDIVVVLGDDAPEANAG
jgi:polyisoprenyl-teichoic acid--peptidoglycan teichoic acid transferase